MTYDNFFTQGCDSGGTFFPVLSVIQEMRKTTKDSERCLVYTSPRVD